MQIRFLFKRVGIKFSRFQTALVEQSNRYNSFLQNMQREHPRGPLGPKKTSFTRFDSKHLRQAETLPSSSTGVPPLVLPTSAFSHFNLANSLPLNSHDNEKTVEFQCGQCGIKFLHRSSRVKNIRLRHTDDRPFACQHCVSTFKKISHLYVFRSVQLYLSIHVSMSLQELLCSIHK